MSQLPTTAESLSAVVSFLVASRESIVRIKRREKDRPVKIFHMDKFYGLFPDFSFGDADDEDEVFLDPSQVINDSVQSSC